jgi:hypothetical protein
MGGAMIMNADGKYSNSGGCSDGGRWMVEQLSWIMMT